MKVLKNLVILLLVLPFLNIYVDAESEKKSWLTYTTIEYKSGSPNPGLNFEAAFPPKLSLAIGLLGFSNKSGFLFNGSLRKYLSKDYKEKGSYAALNFGFLSNVEELNKSVTGIGLGLGYLLKWKSIIVRPEVSLGVQTDSVSDIEFNYKGVLPSIAFGYMFQSKPRKEVVKEDTEVTTGKWVPINISILSPISLFKNPKVKGIDCHIFYGKSAIVRGIQFGLFYGRTNKLRGIQATVLINRVNHGSGLQIGCNNQADDYFKGVQLGLLTNYVNNFQGIQIGGVVNVGRDTTTDKFQLMESFKGLQISFMNICEDVVGVQIGVLNHATNLKGAQIGVLNIARNSKIYPYMLGLNVGW